jgi:hypothetical protein
VLLRMADLIVRRGLGRRPLPVLLVRGLIAAINASAYRQRGRPPVRLAARGCGERSEAAPSRLTASDTRTVASVPARHCASSSSTPGQLRSCWSRSPRSWASDCPGLQPRFISALARSRPTTCCKRRSMHSPTSRPCAERKESSVHPFVAFCDGCASTASPPSRPSTFQSRRVPSISPGACSRG